MDTDDQDFSQGTSAMKLKIGMMGSATGQFLQGNSLAALALSSALRIIANRPVSAISATKTPAVKGAMAAGRILSISCLLLGILAISTCSTARPKPNIEQMLANATTAADHLNIAEYYREEAADDEAKYEEHKADAARYEHAIKFGRISAQHCVQLAQDYKQAAQEASALAAEHHKVADEISAK
jgi:hypothetical protein